MLDGCQLRCHLDAIEAALAPMNQDHVRAALIAELLTRLRDPSLSLHRARQQLSVWMPGGKQRHLREIGLTAVLVEDAA